MYGRGKRALVERLVDKFKEDLKEKVWERIDIAEVAEKVEELIDLDEIADKIAANIMTDIASEIAEAVEEELTKENIEVTDDDIGAIE